jgi:hypothetical protein
MIKILLQILLIDRLIIIFACNSDKSYLLNFDLIHKYYGKTSN